MYDKIYDGLLQAICSNRKVFHVVLTTSTGHKDDYERLRKDFLEFYKRICDFQKKNLDYYVVLTDEGNGTVHCLMVDLMIPRERLSSWWSSIHGAYIVRKPEVNKEYFKDKNFSDVQVVNFMARYMANQKNIVYSWCSDGCDG